MLDILVCGTVVLMALAVVTFIWYLKTQRNDTTETEGSKPFIASDALLDEYKDIYTNPTDDQMVRLGKWRDKMLENCAAREELRQRNNQTNVSYLSDHRSFSRIRGADKSH